MFKSHTFKFSGSALLLGLLVLMTLNADAAGSPFFTIGGPDSFGYSYIDSEETGGPTMNFEDISSSGTVAIGSSVDDSAVNVSMGGITFPYYGSNYTTVNVSSNGNVHFGTTSSVYVNGTMPGTGAPNGMIAIMWDDLYTAGGNVRYQAFLTGSRRFIVQWTSVTHLGDTATTMTFQIKLFESGMIIFNYRTMNTGTYTNGSSATVGVENLAGNVGLQYESNGSPAANNLYTGLVIQWGLGADPNPPTAVAMSATAAGAAEANNFISDATVFFRGTVTDPDLIQTVGVQAEILPLATPFAPTAVTGQLATTTPLVTNGSVAEAVYTFTGTPYGNGSYHWRLRSIDQFSRTSTWVTPAADTFQVDIVAPGLATLIGPPDGLDVAVSTQDGGNIDFNWIAPLDAGPAPLANYDIEVASDNGFASIIAGGTVTSPAYSTYVPTSNNFYYWRVRTRDSVGNLGAFTTAFSFRAVHDDGYNASAGDAGKVCGSGATSSTGAWAMFALLAIAMGLMLRR